MRQQLIDSALIFILMLAIFLLLKGMIFGAGHRNLSDLAGLRLKPGDCLKVSSSDTLTKIDCPCERKP